RVITKTDQTPSLGYIKILGYQGVYDCNNLYRIQVDMIEESGSSGCTDSFYEPNETIASAKRPFDAVGPISKTQQMDALISKSDDVDYYKIGVNGKGKFTIRLENLPHDYDVYLYENNSEIGKGIRSSTNNEKIVINKDISTETVYFIKVVSGLSSYDCNSKYRLIVDWIPDAGSPCNGDPYEPSSGNTNVSVFSNFGSSTSKNTTILPTIHSASDIDYYKVTLSHPGRLRINLTSLPENYDLQIVDANGQLLQSAGSYNTGITNEEVLFYKTSYTTEAVYVYVYSSTGAYDCDDTYSLYGHWEASTQQNCTDTSYEPNESISTANTTAFLSFGNLTKSIFGYISSSTDFDYYKVRLVNQGRLSLDLESLPEDYNVDIFSSNGALLRRLNNSGDNGEHTTLDFGDAMTRDIYVKVYSAFGGYDCIDSYRLSLQWTGWSGQGCPSLDTEWENNDTPNTAANALPLANNQAYTKEIENYIHDPLDVDFYKLNSNTKGWYHLSLPDNTISSQIIISITDKFGNIIKSSSDKFLFFEVKVNLYEEYRIFIKTKNNYYNCNKKYTLNVTWEPSSNSTNGGGGTSNDPCDHVIPLSFNGRTASYSGNVNDGTSLISNNYCEVGMVGKEKNFKFEFDPIPFGYHPNSISFRLYGLTNQNINCYILEECNPTNSYCFGKGETGIIWSDYYGYVEGLTPGNTYYVSVDGTTNDNTFTLEIIYNNYFITFDEFGCGLSLPHTNYQCFGNSYNIILDYGNLTNATVSAPGYNVANLGGNIFKINNVLNSAVDISVSYTSNLGFSCTQPQTIPIYDCGINIENCFGLEPPAAPSITVSCPGEKIPTANIYNPSGYEVTWYEDADSETVVGFGDSFTPTEYGVFYVKFSAPSLGCESTRIPVEFRQDQKLDIVPIVINNECYGDNAGSIELLLDRDTTNFLFDWSNGVSNTLKLTNLTSGEYIVTVTTAYGCESVHNFKINEPERLSIGEPQPYVRAELCQGNRPSLIGDIVALDNIEVGSEIKGIFKTKNFQNVIGSQDSIKWDKNKLKFISVKSTLASDFSYNDSKVFTEGVLSFYYLNANLNGLPDDTEFIDLKFEVLAKFDLQEIAISNNPPFSEWINTIGETIEICTNPIVVTKNVVPIKSKICSGDSVNINPIIIGGTPPYSYNWSTGDTTINKTIIDGGNYVFDVYDANGCYTSTNYEIQKSNKVDIEIVSDTFNQELYLTALSPSFIEGSWNDGTNDITIRVGGEGTYTYTIEDNLGCTSSQSITLSDMDQDGYLSPFDCDDNNATIYPDAIEVVYNGINDDCNPATLDDDLDQDGFLHDDDCDDS
ncbi:MAG: hypothetical protein RLZZ546_2270, partial [Bacteroidota bacterium]